MQARIISLAMLSVIVAVTGAFKAGKEPTLSNTALNWESLSAFHQTLFGPISNDTGLVIQDASTTYFKEYRGSYNNDSVIPLASASKWLSSALIMTLVEDDLIDLSVPAHTYFPLLKNGEKANITIGQLLSHTSGIRPNPLCLLDQRQTLQGCAEAIVRDTLIAKPGTTFAYGGGSMQVAGYIAEKVSGKTWNELFQEKIGTPLGMTDTTFGILTPGGEVITQTKNPRIAGGAQSSLDDFSRFMEMIVGCGTFKGIKILSCESVKALQTLRTANTVTYSTPNKDAVGYGLGLWIDTITDTGIAQQVSSPGAFGFTPWIDTQQGYFGILMIKDTYENTKDEMAILQSIVKEIYKQEQSKELPQ